MGKKYKKSYLSLDEAVKANNSLNTVIECLDFAIETFQNLSMNEYLDVMKIFEKAMTKYNLEEIPKLDLEFKEAIEHPQRIVFRNADNDRKYKLDTIKLDEFSREHKTEVDEATIHIGMTADEYTRSLNALALTIGADIYFRNGAYKPETEEGREILAHELTHVSQNKNKENYRNADKEELENEAEIAENKEKYQPDPYIVYKTERKEYTIRQSKVKEIQKLREVYLEEWLGNMKNSLSEEKYLELLCKYQLYMERQ